MEFIKNSVIYKLLIGFVTILEKGVTNSYIYNLFTKEVNKEEKINSSFFVKIIYKIIEIFRKIFCFLRLDKLFKDSIFAKTYIWVILTIALSPFLSTKITMCLIIATFLSFVLNICMNKEFKFKYTPVNLSVILFLLVYAFCAITSLSPVYSMKIAIVVSSGMIFYVILLNSINTKKQIKIAFIVFCIAGLLVSIYGIYQYISSSFFGSYYVDSDMFQDIKTRVTSTFDNPNVLGEYLLLVIPILVSLFFANKGIIKKMVIGICICIMIACLAFTYSRGCYLGLIFAAAVFVILLNFKFILLFILGIISLPFVLPKSIINRFTSIGNMKDTSTKYRVSIWKGSIELIKDYWYKPIGQSATAFNKVYPLYAYNQVGAQHSHCLYLQVIIETGFVGMIIFISFLFRMYQYILSGIRKLKGDVNRVYLIGIFSGLSGFLLQSVFDYTWYNLRVAIIFWMFISLGVCARNIFCKEEIDEN